MRRIRRFMWVALCGALLIGLVWAPAAGAQGMVLDSLPPGIAMQAAPLLEAMMMHMAQMGMGEAEMAMMMADMQAMAESLPPGIWLQILELMLELDELQMMALHEAIRSGGLLQEPPGRVLVLARTLAH